MVLTRGLCLCYVSQMGTALRWPVLCLSSRLSIWLAMRSADAALRRSIPAFNKDVREVQTKLEDVAFKLRIPQRKPWPAMVDDVRAASGIVAQPDRVSPRCCLQLVLSNS